MARTADERGDYEVAFNALKAGQYAESAQLFQDFLRAHPSGAYAPNAYYWLGESYYVTQNYALAQQQFQALIDRYRSEEHTSELQSLMRNSYAVFFLKKKKYTHTKILINDIKQHTKQNKFITKSHNKSLKYHSTSY